MSGKNIRLAKIFSNGKPVVVAVDHGSYQGPLPGIENLPQAIRQFVKADGVLLMPGMVSACSGFFNSKTSPTCIVRVNWGSHYCPGFEKGYGEAVISVEEAVSLGAETVICSLVFGGSEEANVSNISLFGRVFSECRRLGVPLIGEYIPMGGIDRYQGNIESLALGVRACVEFGADLIKTVYVEQFDQLTRIVPVPVLALGGAKTSRPVEAFEIAYRAIQKGAAGVVFGRNVFQAKKPEAFLEALIAVVKNGMNPQDAEEFYRSLGGE